MSNVSPCGRYEWTGKAKEVDGITVKQYRVRNDTDIAGLPGGISPGDMLGFIDDWPTVFNGGVVVGTAINSILHDASICAGVVKHSIMHGSSVVYDGAVVEDCFLHGRTVVHCGATLYNVEATGGARFGSGCVVEYCGDGILDISQHIPADAHINYAEHLLSVSTLTATQIVATLYRAKGGAAMVQMGCWNGTIKELEGLFMRDSWIETQGEDCERLRPEMLAMVEMFKARVERW